MQLSGWTPSYSVDKVSLRQKNKKIGLSRGSDEKTFFPGEIGAIVLGEIQTYISNPSVADYAKMIPIVEGTYEVLDMLDDFGAGNFYFVTYEIDDGKDIAEDLIDFAQLGAHYHVKTLNPTIGTTLIRDLLDKRLLFVMGVQSPTNIHPFISSLTDMTGVGMLSLENIIVVDSCVNAIGFEQSKELDRWAKYNMQTYTRAMISQVYRGSSKIA
jgi:hypothetical protein